MRIKLIDQFGAECVSLEDGLKLYKTLIKELKNGSSIEIDFDDVKTVYTPFLTGAFLRLFDLFDKEYILSHISLCCLSGELLQRINRFLDEKDRLDSDRIRHATLTEIYDEDCVEDLDGP